ncbi:DDB1- and CUL4-associated factor 17 isoform X1 [Bufo gargarizans]|uniref:DDB1- and CUL4-associated factor 17 isoform X1 n=2 Tax=Bufo gargarizans TaxID=30331 RepID=UPI001CF152A8|nr:DDB1- and CUL4-associated factor 17 isoform X1 [Bufo gargarizans]
MSTDARPHTSAAPLRTRRRLWTVKNVCLLTSRRSLGSFPRASYSHYRINMDILRKIVCKKKTTFKKVWSKQSKSSINYVNGRIYFANFGCCYSSIVTKPQMLYEMPRCVMSEKIEDAMLCECPLGEPLATASDYTPSLIAVTGHNWLLRIAADTGETLQRVYLGSYRKFRYITWNVHQETLVVKSIQKNSVSENERNVMFYFAVFNVFPLSLVGVLEIDKKVFGSNVSDAMISDGMLIVMHSPGLVRLYSFEKIAKECMQQQCVIGETCNWRGETGRVGDFPFGIPCNIALTERPPILFEVPCLENAFQVGGHPWHYIITPNKRKERGTYQIRCMDDHRLAKNGLRDMKYCSLEPEWIHFHPDSSERIIHVGPDQIWVLKLKELEDDAYKYEVIQDFVILAFRDPKADNKLATFTTSGRLVKKRYARLDDDPDLETFTAVVYEDELDLLTVVAVTQIDAEGRAHVDLYCNETGKILKKITLQESWDVTHSHALVFDRDTLIHIEERPNHNFSCYVYKMHCGPEES